MKRNTLILAAFVGLFGGCNGMWPASMEQQASVQPLMLPRPAPVGSVQVGGVEHLEDREDDADLVNPHPRDPVELARGKALFAAHCAVCHAADGHGNGPISKVFPEAPDLRHTSICARTDGFIYGTLTAGGRAMPSMREGLNARDRWALVTWVREIQSAGCVGAPSANPAEPEAATPSDAAAPATDTQRGTP